MTVCKRCVMDDSDPNITFNEQGECNHCRTKLERIIDRVKKDGLGKQYDCIVGLSGGVDSSLTALIAWQHNLRVLALHLDNGWDTVESAQNISRILYTTKWNCLVHEIDFNEFRRIQIAYLKASVIDIEAPTDHAITAFMYQTAAKQGIKHILSGSNNATESIMPKSWGWRKGDLTNIKGILRAYGVGKLKTFPTISTLKKTYYSARGIRLHFPLDCINYNREEAKKELSKAFEWKDYGLKHYESVWTRFYQSYILPTKFGVDKRKAHYSALICSGQMTREQALNELEKPAYQGNLQQDMEIILRKLGLSNSEFEELMRLPVVDHSLYGSDEWLYNLLTKFAWIRNVL